MKKLSKEEAQQVVLLRKLKGSNSWLIEAFDLLEVGEALLLEKDEWNKKYSPQSMLSGHMVRKNKRVRVQTVKEGGFIVTRTF